jgi:hypothetical protein
MRKRTVYAWVISMVLVFAVVLAGCKENSDDGRFDDYVPTTEGKLTITTGLDTYNGKYAFAETTANVAFKLRGAKATSETSVVPVLISEGQVELPVYKIEGNYYVSYNGNDKVNLMILIYPTEAAKGIPVASVAYSDVTFVNGSATVPPSQDEGDGGSGDGGGTGGDGGANEENNEEPEIPSG